MEEAKYCKESRCVKISHVFPTDLNDHRTLFGGKLMAYIDDIASISAARHCRSGTVTASTDSVDFLHPIRETDSVCLASYVAWTGTSSMEVFVKVIAENLRSGERKIAATAFLTFVALDEHNHPTPVPKIIPETPEEQFLYDTAAVRADKRKRHREESNKLAGNLTIDKFWDTHA